MNKSNLIDAVAICSGLSKAQAQRAIECYHNCVKGALNVGDKVAITGFGSYYVAKRDARTGINPQTGKQMHVPSKIVVKFKPSNGLIDFEKG